MVCRLKDFEKEGIRFKLHKFVRKYYDGGVSFVVEYELIFDYKDKKIVMGNASCTYNGILPHGELLF